MHAETSVRHYSQSHHNQMIKCKCNMHVVILPLLKIHKQQREEDWKCVELF